LSVSTSKIREIAVHYPQNSQKVVHCAYDSRKMRKNGRKGGSARHLGFVLLIFQGFIDSSFSGAAKHEVLGAGTAQAVLGERSRPHGATIVSFFFRRLVAFSVSLQPIS